MARPRRTQNAPTDWSQDTINAAMQWGQFQATLSNIQASLAKLEVALSQMVPRSEHESRWAENERRFNQMEGDIDVLRKEQQSGDDRTISQQSAILLAIGGCVITAFLYYVVTHLH